MNSKLAKNKNKINNLKFENELLSILKKLKKQTIPKSMGSQILS